MKKYNYEYILNDKTLEIFEAFYDGIYITDKYATTLYLNSSYEKITGLSKEDILGENMRELVQKNIISKSATLKVLESKSTVTINQRFKTGKKALVTSTPLFNSNNEIEIIVTNVRDISDLISLKSKINESSKRVEEYKRELKEVKAMFMSKSEVITEAIVETVYYARRASKVDSTVLLLGETGVGKEVFANFIYNNSKRSSKKFIKINCATLPENLIESELFGYEKGSFTGAIKEGKAGIFEEADGGTIFLDEIGELPIHLQSKLLRVLQERKITRLGGTREVNIDVRIIAATNKDLQKLINENLFREDLYYRLNVVPIYIPPLRERGNDVLLLSKHFLEEFNTRYGYNKKFSSDVLEYLLCYSWPGNVRELKNIIERLVVLSVNNIITIEDLPENMFLRDNNKNRYKEIKLKDAVRDLERKLINDACGNYSNVRDAAKSLGIDASTLVRKRKKLNCCSSATDMQK